MTPECLDDVMNEAQLWPLQVASVLVERGGTPRLSVNAGHWPTAPVWLLSQGSELFASWDPLALVARIGRPALNFQLAAYFLGTLETPYAATTLVSGIVLVTERSRARWDGSTVEVLYPPSIAPRGTRKLVPNADVTSAAWRILSESVRRFSGRAERARLGGELSGGLDSALVCLAAAEAIGDAEALHTFALLLPEKRTCGQEVRRAELVRSCRAIDHTVELLDALPLASSQRPSGLPWEECYYEAVNAMLDQAVAARVTTMFTGLGGDELCSAEEGEERGHHTGGRIVSTRPTLPFLTARAQAAWYEAEEMCDRAPTGTADVSAMEAVAFGSAQYLRRGIWPVHPLCTPELIRFSQALPAEWHQGRTLTRALLSSRSLPEFVTHAPGTDTFSAAFVHSLRGPARARLESLFGEPCLADLGLVEPKALLQAFRAWCDGPPQTDDDETALPFYAVASLEILVRQLEP